MRSPFVLITTFITGVYTDGIVTLSVTYIDMKLLFNGESIVIVRCIFITIYKGIKSWLSSR